jgi:hypothetical protein
VLNLCQDKATSGIRQYYQSETALDKLLKSVVDARNMELGRLAAFEYEQVTQDNQDYSASVKRNYLRNSIVSTLKPMMIFVQVSENSSSNFLEILVKKCLEN